MTAHLNTFLQHMEAKYPLFWPSVSTNYESEKELFQKWGGMLTDIAERSLGDNFAEVLAKSYSLFVTDVNRSQMKYERAGEYANKTYDEVFKEVYGSSQYMSNYHWGVYTTTFAWPHHLKLCEFYQQHFLALLPEQGRSIDLGCGSGIWSLIALEHLPGWQGTGIDISETSIELSKEMAASTPHSDRIQFEAGDALQLRADEPYDAGISAFVLEHLENPQELLESMAANLKTHSYAFVTGALTAAEVDHIAEFRRESELILMAEDAGFRVVSSFSAAPPTHPESARFLPRSMAMVLQKRSNDVW